MAVSSAPEAQTPAGRLFDADAAEASREVTLRPSRRNLRLFLIRHGESAMNVQPRLIGGRSNSAPLTDNGKAQAAALGRRLAASGISFDRVFSSTARRARETAQIACGALGIGESAVVEVDDVLEICQGEWTGRERAEIYDSAFLERVQREMCFLRAPGVSVADAPASGQPPPGESQWDVECRVAAFVDALLLPQEPAAARLNGQRETVAIFMHGVAIKSFLRRILGASASFAVHCQCANTSITELMYNTGDNNLDGWQVVRVNDAAHLELPMPS